MSAYAINRVTIEYEKEITPASFCVPLKSPAKRVTPAIAAIKKPQMKSLFLDGFILPLLDSIAMTNVPELAEVIRNVATRIKQTIVVIEASGNMSIRSHSAIDISFTAEYAR